MKRLGTLVKTREPSTDGNFLRVQQAIDYLLHEGTVAAHEADTTAIHGIVDTADLALKSGSIAQFTTKSHTSLTDIGTNAHSVIDTHLGSTSNPHSVTYTQVGAEPAGAVATHAGAADPHTDYLKESVLTAKGSMYAAAGAGNVTQIGAPGADWYVPVADSGVPAGVSWTQLPHAQLGNPGTNTHAQIDTHIAATGTSAHGDSYLLNTGDTGTGAYTLTNASGVPLTVNNGAGANSIFVAQDDGTAVFTIGDGGAITATTTGGYLFNVTNKVNFAQTVDATAFMGIGMDGTSTNQVPQGTLHCSRDGQITLFFDSFSPVGGASGFVPRMARGSRADPRRVKSGDALGFFSYRGAYAANDTTTATFTTGGKAALQAKATEDWTSTANGCAFVVETTPIGSTTRAADLQVDSNGLTLTDGRNIITGTTTGMKIGTAITQKLGFFNVTPVVQQAHIANPTDLATCITAITALTALVETLGFTATS